MEWGLATGTILFIETLDFIAEKAYNKPNAEHLERTVSLDQFFGEEESLYSTEVDAETRKRIRLSVAAYAYECMGTSIMSDAEFDHLAYSIDLNINTRRPDLDVWFKANFKPHTGMWVNNHPEKNILRVLVKRIQTRNPDYESSEDHRDNEPID